MIIALLVLNRLKWMNFVFLRELHIIGERPPRSQRKKMAVYKQIGLQDMDYEP